MDNFFYLIKPVFFWLFIASVAVTVLVNSSRIFIKDPALQEKRNFWFYCCLEANMVLLFILGIYGVNMPDHEIWKMVLEISGGMAIIFGFYVFGLDKAVAPKKTLKRKTR